MTKLGSPFKGNKLILTQGGHGSLQNNKALDAYGGSGDTHTLVAVQDGIIERSYGTGGLRGFHLVGYKWDFLYHHAYATRTGPVKKGEIIGRLARYPKGDHLHFSVKVNGSWSYAPTYMDLSIILVPEPGGSSSKWNQRATYGFKDLPTINPIYNINTMARFPGYLDCLDIKTLNTTKMNLRKEPNTKDGTYGRIVKVKADYKPRVFVSGETVEQNGRKSDQWAMISEKNSAGDTKTGYINMCWYDFAGSKPANCDAELARIEALKAQVGNLKNKQSQINTKAKEIDNLSK